jgi:hypothetical protein
MNKSGETGERSQPKVSATPFSTTQHSQGGTGRSGRYLCLRCGWRWSPRPGFPDPPSACSHCRTAYWKVPPESGRANRPDDPKWQFQIDAKADRRRARHLARLRELAHELGPDVVNSALLPSLSAPETALHTAPKTRAALTGDEIKRIILADLADTLAQNGILASQMIVFPRVSYELRVVVHVDNPFHLSPGC